VEERVEGERVEGERVEGGRVEGGRVEGEVVVVGGSPPTKPTRARLSSRTSQRRASKSHERA
jgi:hypothetical protein